MSTGSWTTDVVRFRYLGHLLSCMECHYCDREAKLTVEKDGLRVGLCEEHFQERLEDLSESAVLEDLREELDIDRA